MKKSLTLVAAIVFGTVSLSACAQEKNVISGVIAETSAAERVEVTEVTERIVDENEGSNIGKNKDRAAVEVMGNDEILFSIEFIDTAATSMVITLNDPIQDGYLYVVLDGNVTNHSLESDGSLSDGIVYVENGKAEFTVEYGGEKTVSYTFNVPASMPVDMPMA